MYFARVSVNFTVKAVADSTIIPFFTLKTNPIFGESCRDLKYDKAE